MSDDGIDYGLRPGDPPLRRRLRGPEASRPAQASLVIGWDRSPASVAAVRYTADLARRLDAHVHVVHVVDIDDLPIDPDAPDWGEQLRATVDADAADAKDLLDSLAASWTYHSGHGDPAQLLATVADRYSALMVVIGSPRGGLLSYLDSMLRQSVSRQMIGNRKTPLLLVPADFAPLRGQGE
ncbi:universal stress protein [Gordonia sp. HNM0687]|uniref:Universal stress protein n=1 Tax=Gordonia mangrovi TaxID=2665643 RepID=A0A6L7GLI2_9ACTN|nr:universal stress protein [Gordonia mangrovi]MXP20730.1 universal stress protein [Gordonia mangrovi]UVF78699.1 universal stress protein [Gordonia mangrovi]